MSTPVNTTIDALRRLFEEESQLKTANADLKAEKALLEDRLQNLHLQTTTKDNEMMKLRQDVEYLESVRTVAVEQLEEKVGVIDRLFSKVDKLKRRIHNYIEVNDQLNRDHVILTDVNTCLKEDKAKLEKEKADYIILLSDKQNEIDTLKTRFTELQTLYDEFVKKHSQTLTTQQQTLESKHKDQLRTLLDQFTEQMNAFKKTHDAITGMVARSTQIELCKGCDKCNRNKKPIVHPNNCLMCGHIYQIDQLAHPMTIRAKCGCTGVGDACTDSDANIHVKRHDVIAFGCRLNPKLHVCFKCNIK
jgi:DNA repair exonuclease SbcCD ATPase subunit